MIKKSRDSRTGTMVNGHDVIKYIKKKTKKTKLINS